ncbi:hypothetical protein FHS89_001558 [Rubricella aquisinus]|uniref:Uncharacterized protein n=1 Tax=Rubricella aquisinus TaxID=2028108 RepID=A0A840X0Z2_9RHOB|nr:hypothetical protein [Rubricella aquisinus]MBB5515546.1 hypothetical protein [Rubricella aquisinus]
MTRTPQDRSEDAFLADLFAEEASPAPSTQFLERVTADAAEVAAARRVIVAAPTPRPRFSFAGWFQGMGGAVAAMATAMVIGIGVGYADPGAIAGGISLSYSDEGTGWSGVEEFDLDLVDTFATEG